MPITESALPRIEADLREGVLNNAEVSRKHHVSEGTVKRWRDRLGLPSCRPGRRHYLPESVEQLQASLDHARKKRDQYILRVARLESALQSLQSE